MTKFSTSVKYIDLKSCVEKVIIAFMHLKKSIKLYYVVNVCSTHIFVRLNGVQVRDPLKLALFVSE